MPTPRKVLGVSSSGFKSQMARTILRTSGVARGTTLHNAAPSGTGWPINFPSRFAIVPSNQPPVGMSACRTTRRQSASPTCVFVLPMSKSRIMEQFKMKN